MKQPSDNQLELGFLLDAIFQKYHYDFRSYSEASLQRRLIAAQTQLGFETLSRL